MQCHCDQRSTPHDDLSDASTFYKGVAVLALAIVAGIGAGIWAVFF